MFMYKDTKAGKRRDNGSNANVQHGGAGKSVEATHPWNTGRSLKYERTWETLAMSITTC